MYFRFDKSEMLLIPRCNSFFATFNQLFVATFVLVFMHALDLTKVLNYFWNRHSVASFNAPVQFLLYNLIYYRNTIIHKLMLPNLCNEDNPNDITGVKSRKSQRKTFIYLLTLACLKVIVTVKSSGCLQIGFGPLIIDYTCNFFIWPPNSS